MVEDGDGEGSEGHGDAHSDDGVLPPASPEPVGQEDELDDYLVNDGIHDLDSANTDGSVVASGSTHTEPFTAVTAASQGHRTTIDPIGRGLGVLGLVVGFLGLVVGTWGLTIVLGLHGELGDLDAGVSRLDGSLSELGDDLGELDLSVTDTNDRLSDVDREIRDVGEAVDELIDRSDLGSGPIDVESVASPKSFVSALAASSNAETLMAQRTYLGYSTQGEGFAVHSDLLVPIVRHQETQQCLWVDDIDTPSTMTMTSCDEVLAAVQSDVRGEYPVYFGWHLDYFDEGQFSDEPVANWRMCFSSESDPSVRKEYTDSTFCLDELQGVGIQLDPPVLTNRPLIPELPTIVLKPTTDAFTIYAYGAADNNRAPCVAVNVENGSVESGFGERCTESDTWTFDLAQWLFFRSTSSG